MIASPQRVNARDGATCAYRLGFSRVDSAPIMIGSRVNAEITTAATPMAAPTPNLPISGMPMTSRPAMATITIRPAVTTDDPAVAIALAEASRTLSPAAICSRTRPMISSE